MKKVILLWLLVLIFYEAKAQEYPKHILLTAKLRTDILKWRSYDNMQRDFLNGVGYAYFFNKNWGAKIAYQSIQQGLYNGCNECWIYGPDFFRDSYNYIILKHITERTIKYIDFPVLYRLNYKKHHILTGIGLSYGIEVRAEIYKNWDMFLIATDYTRLKRWGYGVSISYQYSIFRNVGLSAEAVFRQSKDIPNTFSYGIGIFYQIWNKRKEKKD